MLIDHQEPKVGMTLYQKLILRHLIWYNILCTDIKPLYRYRQYIKSKHNCMTNGVNFYSKLDYSLEFLKKRSSVCVWDVCPLAVVGKWN